jgi:putative inorganic carbon (HCO3(-)) transporter
MASGCIEEKHSWALSKPSILALTLVALVLIVALGVRQPLLLLALAIVIPALCAVLVWPDFYTLLVVGLLYTNAAAVAVRFHGVPLAIGMGVPLLLAIPIGWHWLHKRPPVIDLVGQLLVLFCLTQLFSLLFSENRSVSLNDVVETACEGLLLYLLVFNAIRTPEVLRQVTWVLVLAGTAMGALCLAQHATKTYERNYGGFAQIEENPGFQTGETDLQGAVRQRRLAGPVGSQNRFAQIMLMLVPLALFRFWGEPNGWLRMVALGGTALIGLGLMLAFSRGAAVGFAIVVAAMLALGYIRPQQGLAIAIAAGLLLLVVPQFATRVASLGALVNVTQDSSAASEDIDGSLRSRAAEAMSAMLMFADHPLTGVGPGMYPHHFQHYAEIVGTELQGVKVKDELRQPHVLYLGLAAELGLPGLLVFLVLTGVVLLRLERARRASVIAGRHDLANLAAGYLLVLVAYLATGLFLHLSYVRYYWLMIAVASAASAVVGSELLASVRPAAPRPRADVVPET